MQLTQKEASLLKDLKEQEQLCADKYAKHASSAADAQLKNLFSVLSRTERTHYDTICQMEQGTVPSPSGGSQAKMTFTSTYGGVTTPEKQSDMYLCSDLLSSEKHVSQLYNTCVFEFRDENARCILNHIQKEEQEHGKLIYDYMQVNGMYS